MPSQDLSYDLRWTQNGKRLKTVSRTGKEFAVFFRIEQLISDTTHAALVEITSDDLSHY